MTELPNNYRCTGLAGWLASHRPKPNGTNIIFVVDCIIIYQQRDHNIIIIITILITTVIIYTIMGGGWLEYTQREYKTKRGGVYCIISG